LSRDHHQGLLLCWKIRKGISKGVEIERIKAYCVWFYKNHIKPHFQLEEKYIFPLLGNDHELVKKALSDHRRIRKLFEDKEDPERSISLLEEELDRHIRFEERVLFMEIQEVVSDEELKIAQKHHKDSFIDNAEDEFWK